MEDLNVARYSMAPSSVVGYLSMSDINRLWSQILTSSVTFALEPYRKRQAMYLPEHVVSAVVL